MIKRARMLGLLLFGLASVLIPARTVLAQESRAGEAAVVAALGAFALVFVVIALAAYVYMALALSTIAKKTNTENPWLAWIPIINIILMLNIAKKPLWWIILCLVPFVNIVILVLVWMGIAEARNKPNWWGILIIVPIVGLIVPGYLAWAD
jgi:ABC-type Na+ efflux pump permease subunit